MAAPFAGPASRPHAPLAPPVFCCSSMPMSSLQMPCSDSFSARAAARAASAASSRFASAARSSSAFCSRARSRTAGSCRAGARV